MSFLSFSSSPPSLHFLSKVIGALRKEKVWRKDGGEKRWKEEYDKGISHIIMLRKRRMGRFMRKRNKTKGKVE